jgi:cellulose synthase/poly-beta-1,6-N-acetylglucosamine synthase-like glycosyltransferase/beta-mannanase
MTTKRFDKFSFLKLLALRFFLLMSLIGAGLYLYWRFNPLFWTNPFLSAILLTAELFFFANFIIHFPVLWFFRVKKLPVNLPNVNTKISILIPTYNETLDILQTTIQASLKVNIPDNVILSVIILDDGHRPWLKEYVDSLETNREIKYITRIQRTGYKAGNINHYLNNYCDDDWILVLDADFVPKHTIVEVFSKFLGDENIGFLQAPQYFDNIPSEDPFGQDPSIWFDVLQVGRSALDSLICCGTPTVFSVNALKRIGGMQEKSVTEDFATGVSLQSHGYKAFYIRENVAVGKASSDIVDVIQKAQRYATGSFEFLLYSFKWNFGNRLSAKQAFFHFTYPFSFIAPLFTPILILLPVIAIFTGVSPFAIDESGKLYLIAQLVSILCLQIVFFLFVGKKLWRAWQFYWGMFPAVYSALFKAIFHKSVFTVSKKDGLEITGPKQLQAVTWQLLFFLIGLAGLLKGVSLIAYDKMSLSLYPSIGWLFLNLTLLTGVIRVPIRASLIEIIENKYYLNKLLKREPKMKNKLSKYGLAPFFMIFILGIITTSTIVYYMKSSQETRSQGFSGYPIPFDDDTIEDQPLIEDITPVEETTMQTPLYLGFSLEPVDDKTINEMSTLVGDNLTLINAYIQWGNQYNSRLTTEFFQVFQRRGVTPIISWEPWDPSLGVQQEEYNLSNIISGRHDGYIRQTARDISDYGNPVFLRFAHEMNGDWYPWSGTVNGNVPEQYVVAWKHVFDIFKSENVTNVTWIWSPNAGSVPNIPTNTIATYYPGDDYTDWVGLDGYNWGALQGETGWRSFDQIFSKSYNELTTITKKPIMIAEIGSIEEGGNKGNWLKDILSSNFGNKYPQIKALVFFNLEKEADWRVQSSEASLSQFVKSLNDISIAKELNTHAKKIEPSN